MSIAFEDAERHRAKVGRIAEQLRTRRSTRPLSLRKKAVSHVVPKRNDAWYSDDKVDIGDLDAILSIDVAARTCTAESGVTFRRLVEETLRYGLVPTVVPELATITVGGAVSGCSLESMSFRHGGFHDSCLEYEVITAKGDVLHCTPENEHRQIFEMMHGSFGTLGIVSKLTFRLVPAKPYVRIRYETYATLAEYLAAIERHYRAVDVDFMDGIIHGPDRYVLSVGTFVDEAPYTNRYDWMKVYYRSTATRTEDYLRTPDYFFRYDRGVTNVHPKSALGRLLFGKLLDSSTVLRIAQKLRRFLLPSEQPDVTVDLFIPLSRITEFMEWYRGAIDFFPLWCVPYRRVRRYEWIAPQHLEGIDDELFIDLAIYGLRQPQGRNYYREIEEELLRIGGIKTLISYNYYEEEEFWKIWNRSAYDAVKKITDPDNVFRDLFTKTCLASRGLGPSAG